MTTIIVALFVTTVVLYMCHRVNYKPDNERKTFDDCIEIDEKCGMKTIIENGKIQGYEMDK